MNAEKPMDGRIAIVTGASSGIGRATALWLLAAGAKVLANARGIERLQELETHVRQSGSASQHLRVLAGDAGDPQVIERLLADAESAWGPADLVLVSAGRGLSGSILTSDPNQWEELIRINILGAMHLMRAAGQRMKAAREAAGSAAIDRPRDIIILGSTVGRFISPFSSAYGGTKFAVGSLAEALRRELGPAGIRVTLIQPGIVRTGFQQVAGYTQQWFDDFAARIGPVLDADDVARAIGFVVSQPAHVHVNDLMIRPTRQDYP